MSTVLVVDSACDLSQEFIDKYQVRILPAQISMNGRVFEDIRDIYSTRDFYIKNHFNRKNPVQSAPTPIRQIEDVLQGIIREGHQDIVIETGSRLRNALFEQASQASTGIEHRSSGQQAVSVKVMDSRTLFAGQALLATYTQALINKGITGKDLRRQIDDASTLVHSYLVPKDITYISERSKELGNRNFGTLDSVLGKAFDRYPVILAKDDKTRTIAKIRGQQKAVEETFEHVTQSIQWGLKSPYVFISYSGDPSAIDHLPGYHKLEQMAAKYSVKIFKSMMSMSGAIDLGPEAISIAIMTSGKEWH